MSVPSAPSRPVRPMAPGPPTPSEAGLVPKPSPPPSGADDPGSPPAALPSARSPMPTKVDLTGALDRDVLASLFDDEEGRQLAGELVQGFFELAPEHLRAMEMAVECGDLEACARVAHKFVSTSGTVGAIRLAQMLREVEQYARRGDANVSARLVAGCREETDRARRALRATYGA
ncbi:MAG: Hpt domain-containing protein [Planctomycetota bacterium]